jgi:hypothetical protein
MKKIFTIAPGIIFMLVIIFSSCKSYDSHYPIYSTHEDSSKGRYEEMQKDLDYYVQIRNTDSLRFLSARLDAQLKVEDFLIKFRQVDSIKFTLSSPLISGILTALVSIATTLLTLFFKQKISKSSPEVVTKALQ